MIWTCDACGLTFATATQLTIHRGIHVPDAPRKPVQIAVAGEVDGSLAVFALANDGTLWACRFSASRSAWDPWTRFADLPLGDGVERPGQRK